MNLYTLRVDIDDPTKLLEALKASKTSYYLQREIADKTKKIHYQGWITTKCTLNHMQNDRSHLGRYLKTLPPSVKSLAKVRTSNEQVLGYILNNPSKAYVNEVHTTYTVEEMDDYRLQCKDYVSPDKDNDDDNVNVKGTSKCKSVSFSSKVVEEFRSQYRIGTDLNGEDIYQELTDKQVVKFVLSYFIKNNSKCPKFVIADICRYCMCLVSKSFEKNLVEEICHMLV